MWLSTLSGPSQHPISIVLPLQNSSMLSKTVQKDPGHSKAVICHCRCAFTRSWSSTFECRTPALGCFGPMWLAPRPHVHATLAESVTRPLQTGIGMGSYTVGLNPLTFRAGPQSRNLTTVPTLQNMTLTQLHS